MSVHEFDPRVGDALDPETALERATAQLDAVLAEICRLIGPNAMTARVAGRIARAARLLGVQP